MISFSTASRKTVIAANVMALILAGIVPALVSTRTASAGQLSLRKITMTSSKIGQTSVTYNFSFRPAVTTNILGIGVQFCQNSPLPDSTCTTTNGVTGAPADVATVAVSHNAQNVTFDVDDGDSNQSDSTLLTHATGLTSVSTSQDITFNFTVTNPSGTSGSAGAPGTFYARVATYSTVVNAQTFNGATGATGTHIDFGGVALSTARQLTVNARVQEQLEFCVAAIAGTINSSATTPANCTAFPTTTSVDIGVVDSATPSVSPVATTSGGNATNGGVMIRTNAVNGATISYFAEQETSSGKLKVAGQTCTDNVSQVDQCFNSAGATQANFQTSVAGEKFGMTAGMVLRPTGSTTTNLVRDTDYDGNGTATAGACVAGTIDSPSCFAWVDTGTNNPAETLATSTTVLDYEMLVLNFAARAAATTPTGAYAVTSTYIATSTF